MAKDERARVVSILIAPAKGEPMASCVAAEAIANEGLAGDRYATGQGYYSGDKVWDANVTLIQQEAFDAVNQGHEAEFTCEMLRRNIVTHGVKLTSLIGRTFQIGEVVLRGTKEWPPCNYISKLNNSIDLKYYFAHCAGIGAKVVQGGTLRVGDEIVVDE